LHNIAHLKKPNHQHGSGKPGASETGTAASVRVGAPGGASGRPEQQKEGHKLRKTGIVLMSVFLLIACLGTSRATVLNFDDLSGWGTVPVNYGGLTWNDSWWSLSGEPPHYTAFSNPIVVTSYDNMNGVSWTGLNSVKFQDPGTFQGAYFSGYELLGGIVPNTIGYDLYYLGTKVANTPDVAIGGTPLFIASGYSGLVDEVYIRGFQSYFVMDNFTFNSAVPIPPSLLLLGPGLLGLAAIRRRLKK
jgi:hypothetical protein